MSEYEKTYTSDEILPSIREDSNLNDARVRLECERAKPERARERLNNAVAEKKLATAKELRELALASTDDDLRNELIRQAARILVGKNFLR